MIIDFSAHHISRRIGKMIEKAGWYGKGYQRILGEFLRGYRYGWRGSLLSVRLCFFMLDRTVYGTDYPFEAESGEDFYRENLAGVKAMKISAKDMKKILGENAKKPLKIP